MTKPRPIVRRPFDLDLRIIRVEFAGDGGTSVLLPALVYTTARIVAKLLTMLVPMSAGMAFLTTILWLIAALLLFVVVTWQRDDNWLAAGILIAATFVVAAVLAEVVGQLLAPGSFANAALAVANASIRIPLRGLLLVPLAGGFVAGARWLTAEIRRSDVWTS